MKIQDMILVIQNIKGSETNMLMTVKEYKEAYLFVSSLSREESAQALKELFDTKFSEPGNGWAERYITVNKSYYAKFCSGSDELQCFLHGSYNDDKKFQFDREESSWGIAPETDRKSQMEQLKAFTKQEVRGILKGDFGRQFAEAAMLAGREITGGENETPELVTQKLIFNSIFYAVGTRCGFDLGSEESNLGAIVIFRVRSGTSGN